MLIARSCSGTSRKTRIETEQGQWQYNESSFVAVELPEKQGLKRRYEREDQFSYEGLQWNFQKNKD